MHTFKHLATLQHQLPHNPHPLLGLIQIKAGHGAGKSTEQRLVSCCVLAAAHGPQLIPFVIPPIGSRRLQISGDLWLSRWASLPSPYDGMGWTVFSVDKHNGILDK